MRKLFWVVPLGWLFLVALWSGGMMRAAFVHNPQGEFQDQATGAVHWDQLLLIGGSWFVIFGLIPAACFGFIAWVVARRSPQSASGAV